MTVLQFAEALLPGGWAKDVRITVSEGRIVSVAPGATGDGAERHAVGLPGLASLHSHAFQRGMAGLSEHRRGGADSFWTWRDVMYRFALTLDPSEVAVIAEQLYVEMLEAGFTAVGEFHYLHHDRDGRPYADAAEMAASVVSAADAAGLPMTLLPVYYRTGGFAGEPANPEQRRFVNDPDGFGWLMQAVRRHAAAVPGTVVGIAPHSLRAAPIEDIGAVLPLAEGGPVHIHVAEQVREVEDCLAATGARPVEHLLASLPVDGRWCLIHATHMTAEEAAGVAARRAVAGLCPVTEANLGDGIFDLPAFAARGGAWGIGTDSNVALGAAEELRQLEYSQRLATRTRNVACADERSTGRTLFDAALAGGAQALGRDARGLAVGAPADIVSLAADHPFLAAKSGDGLLDGWIFSAGNAAVDCVWTAGAKRVEGGRHVRRKEAAARFRAVIGRLVANL